MRSRLAVIAVVVATFAASPAFAQTVSGGVKVGLNLANIDVEFDEPGEEPEFDTKIGLIIGGYVEVPFNDRFSFQPEFLFTQKGAKFEEADEEIDVDLDFIQIPLLARVNFPTGGTTRPYLLAGPGIGFKTKAQLTSDGVEEDLDEDIETVEFSGVFGGGVEFGAGLVEVRYDYGFNDLDKDESEVRSRTFSVLFGVRFGR